MNITEKTYKADFTSTQHDGWYKNLKPKTQNMTVTHNVDTEIMDYRESIANKI